MRYSNTLKIIFVALSLCILSSCTKGGSSYTLEISPSDKSIIDLSSKTYDTSQLLQIIEFTGSIHELNAQYPIECLREINGFYRVSYLGDGRVAVLMFDPSGNNLSGSVYSTQQPKKSFDELSVGQSLEDVRAVDPDGEYSFLFTGRNDIPKVSTHYTTDGYMITIEYSASNTITGIIEELI